MLYINFPCPVRAKSYLAIKTFGNWTKQNMRPEQIMKHILKISEIRISDQMLIHISIEMRI